jgi:hypothetical protein
MFLVIIMVNYKSYILLLLKDCLYFLH